MHTYRNGFYREHRIEDGPEFIATDVEPVRIGKYLRFHRIKDRKASRNCYDFVCDGVLFAQRCGPATEAEIDADEYAQDNLRRLLGSRIANAA